MSPSQDSDDHEQRDAQADSAPGSDSDGESGDLTPWYSRWPIQVGALVVIALIGVGVVALVGGSPESEPKPSATAEVSTQVRGATPAPTPTQDALQNEIHSLGDVVTVNTVWEVTVQDPVMNATEDVLAASQENAAPAEGSVYALVYLSATNTGDEPRTLYDDVGVTYIGPEGTQFASADAVGPDDAYLVPTVEPGQTVSGSYVFEIPQEVTGGYWLVGPADDTTGSSWKAFANAPSESPS